LYINFIFDAGYASDPKYIEKLVNLIETSDLTKYDASIEKVYHIVQKRGYRLCAFYTSAD
jgi:flagellum-specific peptidoglycan hydrolase FlgJ